jgi:hypothetical protein
MSTIHDAFSGICGVLCFIRRITGYVRMFLWALLGPKARVADPDKDEREKLYVEALVKLSRAWQGRRRGPTCTAIGASRRRRWWMLRLERGSMASTGTERPAYGRIPERSRGMTSW